ncbi:fatty acyl-CoA reductase 3-like [Andrographis paniculata]|uniref:fatty acyl-CoA reductase 3-like n=1 Tax=Andrographis paniculata TaxID=175694 RepID=UPI0021E723D7|nr:fatty acyl-CoA reductase 3-like [Andrographis paniculata]
MEEDAIFKYFEGKSILITGATGFVAKVFLEKILRLQPNIKKMYLLIRGNDKKTSEERLKEEIINTELFRVLREGHRSNFDSAILSKIVPMSGDVSQNNLGIVNRQLREEMFLELDIIVNSAATVRFDDRYDVSFNINTLGAMHVRDFAMKCPKLDTLLHVSTAYVHGMRVGVIPEIPFCMGETLDGSKLPYIDFDAEKTIIKKKMEELQSGEVKATEREISRAMKDLGTQRSLMHGWPNTYVFTKAMGEMLVESFKEKARVIILRPTIITSTYKEPFPGWIEGLRTMDSIFAAYGKRKFEVFVGDPESVLDLIPCDMVVNGMLTAIAVQPNHHQRRDLLVYHIGSSRRNPLKFSELKWIMHRYLVENPLLDERGRAIKIGQPKTLNSIASYRDFITTRYSPFLTILKFANIVSCNLLENLYTKESRRLNHALRLIDLYKPYIFFKGIFDDANAENLRRAIKGRGDIHKDMLNFDPMCIKWDEYLEKTHFPGVVKHAMN